MKPRVRCEWARSHPLLGAYHDREWGAPQHDDRRLFELLVLEGAQAGLSWLTILKKREAYRRAFAGFDPRRVARFGAGDVERLLGDPGIVRNRLKVQAAVANAKATLEVQREVGALEPLLWGFVGGRPKVNAWRSPREVPASTPESGAMTLELKRWGFRFVGPTVCYAFMQAAGMVNDHTVSCYRWREVQRGARR